MNNSILYESSLVDTWAERINSARKLYGKDSSYVIGMMTVLDWMSTSVEGGAAFQSALLAKIETSASAVEKATANAVPASQPTNVPSGERRESLDENTWISGAVKWFNNDKGYGFISTDSEVDVFVHWRDISSWDRSLIQGDEVEFMVTRTAKGFQAINVMKAGAEEGSQEGEDGIEEIEEKADGDDLVHSEINSQEHIIEDQELTEGDDSTSYSV